MRNTSAADTLLTKALARPRGLHHATALLLVDTAMAIGFAGGVAGAIASIAHGGEGLAGWTLLAATAAAGRALAAWAAARVGSSSAARAKRSLRADVVAHVLRGSKPGHTQGTLMNAAVDEVEAIDGWVARFMPARQAAALAPWLVLAAAACASPVAALILAATLPPFVALMALAGAASAAESRRQFTAMSRLAGLFADRLRALPLLLAFGATKRETEKLAQAADAVAEGTLRVLRLAFLSSSVLEFFAALCVALVAMYAGFHLLGLLPFRVPERLDLARAFFVLALAPEFYAPMRRLAAAYHDRQAALTAAERLAVADEARPTMQTPVIAVPPRIVFDDVTLVHDAPVVRRLSFDLPPGRVLALVGPSGSGKTTVLRALLGGAGAARVTEGRIRLGTVEWTDGLSLAAHAAWVGQSPLIVPGTLRDNLRLAAPDAGDEALAAAVVQAGLRSLIDGRPEGLDTRLDARGSGLSGGERQRIALARALLRPAAVWLLDEPTAHLDEASELALIETLSRQGAGRTMLIATHSRRVAALADVVVDLGALS